MKDSKNQRTTLPGDEPRKTNPYASLFNRTLPMWKRRTATLPDEARAKGVYPKHNKAYPICLPVEFASHPGSAVGGHANDLNLRVDLRKRVLAR